MSDKSVYAWIPKSTNQGLSLGGLVDGMHIDNSVFKFGRPLKESIIYWKTFIGVQKAIAGTHSQADYIEEVSRTLKWLENPYPIPCVSFYSKEKLETLDTPHLIDPSSIVCSQKVVDILTTLCPDDFEAYPITIETPTGVSNNFSIINITNVISPSIEREQCIYKIDFFDAVDGEEDAIRDFERLVLKEHCMGNNHLGRMYDYLGKIMLNKSVIDTFKKGKINGFRYQPLEDYINSFYTTNFHPGTHRLKV